MRTLLPTLECELLAAREAIEDVSLEIAHKRWRLGRKGEDNGVLLLVAAKDRKYRIETL